VGKEPVAILELEVRDHVDQHERDWRIVGDIPVQVAVLRGRRPLHGFRERCNRPAKRF
jgi:hypothetical protein